MPIISLPKYDKCRKWIRDARTHGYPWDVIKYALKTNESELEIFLENQINNSFWPIDIDKETWLCLVNDEKDAEAKREEITVREKRAVLIDECQDSDVFVPEDERSSWQLYKKHLLDSGWKKESVDEIERATITILKRLNNNTSETGPIKGLVIGHVQSGKTANMAALMAMAADWGWNMVVVLSGTIENLRKQTQSRLFRDLYRPGNIIWQGLEHLSKNCDMGKRAQDLRFEDSSVLRYFTVCLKNSKRLKNLIEWMQTDPNKYKQMKIIVIDDEADQASINTADVNKGERAKINKLIVNLVEGNKHSGEVNDAKPKAMNYISYTATPYANFLNESGRESLYPRNFIAALQTSNEYFGPKQIFGAEGTDEYDGLNIVREIKKEDLDIIKLIHKGEYYDIPQSLKESICWFLCASSTMRVYGYTKPISMLVHTSQKQQHHKELSEAIRNWLLSTDRNKLVNMCKLVWEKEIKELTIDSFREAYLDYGRANEEINDYPSFAAIVSHIDILLEDITHIPLGEDGELQYTSNIHLCVDNCANNGVNEEGMFVRLAYPDLERRPYPSPAPVFIIVGGSTLSRGLTIEGLVSTYFLRSSCQADSLMQMGRWFGYRKGYELLPRIWMTNDTIEKFKFLALLEMELREDLRRFTDAGADPSVYGPRVNNTPKISWIKITAKNKMQSAEEIEMDFSGTTNQTVIFDNDIIKLKNNIDTTVEFIKIIGDGEISDLGSSFVWHNVEFSKIYEVLLRRYHSKSRSFNEMDAFCKWIHEVTVEKNMGSWNVIVAGSGRVNDYENNKRWVLPGGSSVGKINRSKKKNNSSNERISIGALLTPKDLVADIDLKKQSPEFKNKISTVKSALDAQKCRNEAGLDKTPQLIIYMIDKNSEAKEDSEYRVNLNADEDIIGLCIAIPGTRDCKSLAKRLTVKVTKEQLENESELGDE